MIKLWLAAGSPEGFLKHRLMGPIPRVSHSEGLVWGSRTSFSNIFPGDTSASGQEATALDKAVKNNKLP